MGNKNCKRGPVLGYPPRVCIGGRDYFDAGVSYQVESCEIAKPFLPEDMSCCAVNPPGTGEADPETLSFVCAPGYICSDDGCCKEDDPSVCIIHVPNSEPERE